MERLVAVVLLILAWGPILLLPRVEQLHQEAWEELIPEAALQDSMEVRHMKIQAVTVMVEVVEEGVVGTVEVEADLTVEEVVQVTVNRSILSVVPSLPINKECKRVQVVLKFTKVHLHQQQYQQVRQHHPLGCLLQIQPVNRVFLLHLLLFFPHSFPLGRHQVNLAVCLR